MTQMISEYNDIIWFVLVYLIIAIPQIIYIFYKMKKNKKYSK